jgi:hypothetical protein
VAVAVAMGRRGRRGRGGERNARGTGDERKKNEAVEYAYTI